MIALNAAGIRDANDLRRAWDARFKTRDGKPLNKQTAHNWINGNFGTLDAENLFRLADLTSYSARWILRREGPPGKWLPADPDRLALMEIYDALPPAKRDTWIKVGVDMVPDEKKLGPAVFTELAKKTTQKT